MVVTFPSEVEKQIVALATQRGVDPSAFVAGLLESTLHGQSSALNGKHEAGDDEDREALSRAVAELQNRTPEERAAMRERVLAKSPAPLPIPDGQTIFDVIPKIRGTETEAEFYAALERLS